jgi:N-sulfoglucosamine sulfohydrolase
LPGKLTKQLGGPRVDKSSVVSSVDLLPTLLELLGVAAPEDLDGRSLVPLMKGETQSDRDFVVTHVNSVSSGTSFPGRCIRTPEWSYQWYPWVDGQRTLKVEAMSGLSMKALLAAAESDSGIKARVSQYYDGTREGFFDLTTDPDERRNLINDPATADRVKEAKRRLLEFMRRTGDPLTADFERLQ